MRRTFCKSMLLAAVTGAGLCWSTVARADTWEPEVWVINTRCAPRASVSADADKRIRCCRRTADGRWERTSREQLLAPSEPAVPTAVFVHGNRDDTRSALADGLRLLSVLRCQRAPGPFRFVIWSWPSDRIRGSNRVDVRLKAAYSDVQGYYLADFLRRIDPEVPVGLVGYSFGARVVTVALHLLDGGRLCGRVLPPLSDDSAASKQGNSVDGIPRRQAVLIAAAIDAHWLVPGQRHGRALTQVERLLVTRNVCDPVLRYYPLMYRRGGPQALGYTGAVCGRADLDRVEMVDVSPTVGRAHGWADYLAAPVLRRRLVRYTYADWQPPGREAATE